MQKAWRWMGGVLFTLSTIGGSTLWAQSSYRPAVHLPTPATPIVVASTSTKAVSEKPTSPLENLIELAWLSDPITFPFDLIARIKGEQMCVMGQVSSQAVRDRALLLAGQYSTVPVLDKMQVNSGLAHKVDSVPVADLQQAVMEALAKNIGDVAKQFEIRAHTSGQVSIAGDVPSLETKLAVSKTVRGVKGCACVINLLNVGAPPKPSEVIVSRKSVKSITDHVREMIVGELPRKSSAPEDVSASLWKRVQAADDKVSKSTPVAKSADSAQKWVPAASIDKSPDLPQGVKTVAHQEKSPKQANAVSGPAIKEVAEDKGTPTPLPERLPERLPSKPLEATKTVSPTKETTSIAFKRMKQEIESICGRSAHNIQVSVNPDKSVAISFECGNKMDAERLSQQILHMRTLAPYEVSLDVHYEP